MTGLKRVPLPRKMREPQKQAAQELGQWAERKEVGGKNGEPVKVEVVYVNDWRSLPDE